MWGGGGGYLARLTSVEDPEVSVQTPWKTIAVPGLSSTHNITGVYMSSIKTAMLVTDGGAIFWTGDNGETWAEKAYNASTPLSFLAISGRNSGDISAGARPSPLLSVALALLLASIAVSR